MLFYYFHYYFINSLKRPILDLKIPLVRRYQVQSHRQQKYYFSCAKSKEENKEGYLAM